MTRRIYASSRPMDYRGDLRSMSREDADFWAWRAAQRQPDPVAKPGILQRIFGRAAL